MINRVNCRSSSFKGNITTAAIKIDSGEYKRNIRFSDIDRGEYKRNIRFSDILKEKKGSEKPVSIDADTIVYIQKCPDFGYTKIATENKGNELSKNSYYFVPLKKVSTAEILAAYNAVKSNNLMLVSL